MHMEQYSIDVYFLVFNFGRAKTNSSYSNLLTWD